MDTLTPDEIAARLAQRQRKAEEPAATYRHIRPFARAAEELIDSIANAEGRWLFGIIEIDSRIRGVGRGELMYVTGRAHTGKTQLVLQSIVNNPEAKVIVFTPDEVDVLILTKLIGMTRGWNAEDLEKSIKAGDQEVMAMVRRVAADEFRNLIVVDDSLTFEQMSIAMAEAEDYWGGPGDVVVIDFLELLPGDAEHAGVTWKSQQLKRWAKVHDYPVVCLHQASRSSGARGQSAGLSAMRYGGETEAIFVLEVYRKLEDESLDAYDRERHANTLSVAITKNKRPPSRKGEFDLFIHPTCGAVRPLRDGDLRVHHAPPRNTQDALEQRAAIRAQGQS